MSNEIIAGVVGAVIGALVTAIVSLLLQRKSEKGRRNWDIALRTSQTLGSILSAYTPDAMKGRDDVWKLQEKWGRTARELSILGEGPSHGPLAKHIDDYFQALIAYVDGKMQRGELEHRRTRAKDSVTEIMARYTKV